MNVFGAWIGNESHLALPRERAAGIALALGLMVWAGGSSQVSAASLPSGFIETEVAGYWDEAAGLVFDSANVMYVWDRQGRVWIVENDVKRATPLIDISEEVGAWNDYGLLGFALHPNFRQNGYIYLLYVVDHHHLAKFGTPSYSPNQNEYQRATIGRLTRYTARASDSFRSVDPASRLVLIGQGATNGFPITYLTHGVGSVLFATDGTLLISCGDGAALSDSGSDPESYYSQALSEGIFRPKENIGAYRSQLVDSLNGKILRIDPDTGDGIPSNPFYDPTAPRAPRSLVWALGLRNPFRMTLRPGTGSHSRADADPGVIYVGDVGYFTWEEQSVVTGPGMNFGWPIFEGYSPPSSYDGTDPANLDAPNPLFGIGGCTKQYFSFRDLLKEATLGTPSWPNPCNTSQQVPASIPHFLHSRPAIDWKHGNSPSRVGIFSGNNATTINVGAAGSPVTGPQFGGNCSIGGTFYQGDDFPATYKNTYFQGDLGNQWIKNFVVDTNNNLLSVRDFASGASGLVFIGTHPINGNLYYIDFFGWMRRINYVGGGNRPPVALASANLNYGPGPLTVQFTGSGSSDPDGNTLTYRWNFGDGTAISTAANPSHTFNAPAGVPTRYDVTLTVTDTSSATNAARLIISVNNTPPNVTVTSPAPGTLYSMSGQTTYTLAADVTDPEHSQAQLSPQWQVVLHHNNHSHPEPVDTNWSPTVVISPLGCDGDTYFYRFTLTVTDAAGLAGSSFVDVYPNCTSNAAPTISDISNQTIASGTSTGPIGFTVGDLETTAGSLTISGGSSNPTLVPAGNIGFGGSGANRTVTVTPAAGQSGTATITVTVSDGSASASDVFVLSVNPANNTPPTISDISNFAINEDASTGPIAFNIGDAETAAGSLTLSRASSNPTLVPAGNIVFGGSGAFRTVTVTPAANQFGSATITVTVNDGVVSTSDTFVLTVNSVNDLPTISNLADLTIGQNTAAGPLSFTVGDLETAAGNLTVGGSSSNPALVPDANITFGGSGASRTVTVTPLAGQTGTATITVTVNDGSASVSDTFILTVTAAVAPTYLFVENFDAAGYENTGWIESGTPNEDYTTTVLSGTQSLNCSGAQSIRRPFNYGTSFNAYFQARWITYSAYQPFVAWTDPSWSLVIEAYCNNAGGPLTLCHGGTCATGTTPLNPATTYHFWVEWTQGTGANGTLKLFVSTTGTKPASPEINITTGNGAATSQILFGPQSSGNVILDRLLVDDVPIGSNPGSVVNQAPTISNIADQTINQNSSTTAIPFTVGDAETAAASLTVSGTSSNPTLVPNANIVFGGSGASRTVTVTPAAGQAGAATITVIVSDGSLTASDPFVLTVNAPANTSPTLSNIADRSVNEDTATGAISFTVSDAETAAGSLTVTGSSSNPTVVPNANIVFGGSGALRTVTVTPAANQSGTATVTVSVSDGSLSTNDTFVLTIVAVNDVPTISNIADRSVAQDASTGPVAFTVGDVETAAASLVLAGGSSNQNLVPNANIVFGGSGANRTVTVTPAAGQSGAATITLTVGDGTDSAADTFLLTVVPNTVPNISNIADQGINEDTATAALAFTVGDAETAAGSLAVSGSSSDQNLVPNAGIAFGGSGANRTVTVTPAADQSGTATITVTVTDGISSASDTFVLTVNPVNDPPTISNIADRSVVQDTSTGPVAFTVGDVESAAGSLTLNGSSSNPAVVPDANIVFGGTGANRTVTVTPAAGQVGSATITVTVSDGGASASDAFVLNVTSSGNTAPTISDIADRSINEDANTGAIAFTIGDAQTAAASLVLSRNSSNPTLVPVNNIVLGGSGANRTVTVTPSANQFGTAVITVTVGDGSLSTSDTFLLTVSGVNDGPTISNIANRSTLEDTSTGPIAFTIGDVDTLADSLVLTAASSNPTRVPVANIVFGGSGTNRTVAVLPGTNQSGSATITITVSDGLLTASDPFSLTITSVNDAPTISDIADRTVAPGTSTGAIAFTIGDAETTASSLTLRRASSNQALVPTNNITFGGSGANRTVTVTPAAGQTGSSTITVTVSDGTLSTSDSFILTVNAPNNTAPTISDIADVSLNEDTASGAIAFTIGDGETAAGALVLTRVSSNATLLPTNNIVFGGSGASRTVTVTPAANQSGTATVTVTVSDGTLSASDTFLVAVSAVNDAPTISNIADTTIAPDATAGPLGFTVGDLETAAGTLTVTGTSSNPALVPDANIVFGGSGASRTVAVTPLAGQTGTATITVTVSDGAAAAIDTFVLTVSTVTAPTYLFAEGFEGTGYENTGWIETGTPNEDYTTTVLSGTQSLNCSGAQSIRRPFSYGTSFNVYFQARWTTFSAFQEFVAWTDPDWSLMAELYCNGAGGPLTVCHGGVCVSGTTPLNTGTTYHFWVEWTQGTGANGTMKLFVSTTGAKPASPEVSITTGTGGAMSQILFGPQSSGNVILDRLLVDDVSIGSNP